ncbi:unnamed protein product [Penicillium camemberti]|uniref:Str. FM013 n=1 Tax=Penicillium camemberti (strain FM 013) TaxID=1429867 RepID=A0A0G4NY07_PENC3|nr:unnamed protein product [Penicillium camemberti]
MLQCTRSQCTPGGGLVRILQSAFSQSDVCVLYRGPEGVNTDVIGQCGTRHRARTLNNLEISKTYIIDTENPIRVLTMFAQTIKMHL